MQFLATLSVPNGTEHLPPVTSPAPAQPAVEDKKELLVLSVTIINPGADLPLPTWHLIGEWMSSNTAAGAFGLERGDAENNAHAQGIIKYVLPSSSIPFPCPHTPMPP